MSSEMGGGVYPAPHTPEQFAEHLVAGHACLPDRIALIDADNYEGMHDAAHEQDDPFWNGGHTHE